MSEFSSDEIEGIVQALEQREIVDDKIPLKPVFKAEFTQLSESEGEKGSFKDLDVAIEVVYGKTELPLKEVLSLHEGSVIKLSEQENQLVEIVAHGRKIGYGQIVIVEGRFGVQIVRLTNS